MAYSCYDKILVDLGNAWMVPKNYVLLPIIWIMGYVARLQPVNYCKSLVGGFPGYVGCSPFISIGAGGKQED